MKRATLDARGAAESEGAMWRSRRKARGLCSATRGLSGRRKPDILTLIGCPYSTAELGHGVELPRRIGQSLRGYRNPCSPIQPRR
jgi:hypothetical protein